MPKYEGYHHIFSGNYFSHMFFWALCITEFICFNEMGLGDNVVSAMLNDEQTINKIAKDKVEID